jgi:hypothetical protein
MNNLTTVLLAFIAFATTALVQADDDKDYIIKSYTSKSGNKVNVLICKNGTTNCNYRWNDLCESGKAYNANPEGNEDEAPAYMRDSNNVPMRIFICK